MIWNVFYKKFPPHRDFRKRKIIIIKIYRRSKKDSPVLLHVLINNKNQQLKGIQVKETNRTEMRKYCKRIVSNLQMIFVEIMIYWEMIIFIRT